MPTILDQHGHPIDRGVLKEPQTSRIAQLTNTYLEPALNGLSPARLAAALRDADNGDLIAQHRIFADMEERDAHMLAEMNKRKLALVDLDWDIVPPRNATAAEKANAEWVKEVLEDGVDALQDLILALAEGIGHGFSAAELEWRVEGKEWLPAYKPRPQEWFRLDTTRSEIRLRDCSIDGAQLQPFGWVWHGHGKAKTGYMGRMGLYRTLVWPFIYKAYAIGDFAEMLETFGLPIIIGKYYPGARPEEKASLMRAVVALGHDARAIMPNDMQVEISKITGSGDSTPHLAMVDWAERSVSKAILGQTTSSEAKATGMGSGVADLHGEVRQDIRNADARQIAATITRDLIYSMLALNRGGVDSLRRCPRLVFDTGEAEDLAALADALPKLVGVGFKVPREWAQEKARIPEPQEGEEVLGIAQPAKGLSPAERPPVSNDSGTPAVAANSAQLGDAVPPADPVPVVPDQEAIDAALEAIPAEVMNRVMGQIVEPVLTALERADGIDGALAILSAQYPQMNSTQLETLLAQSMFSAAVWGHSQADA